MSDAITISSIYQEIKHCFMLADIDNPELDARLLLQHTTKICREDFILKADNIIPIEQYNILQSYKKRRLLGEPVSRIIGKREFYGSDFLLSPETLDPRPDTEVIIEAIIKHVNSKPDLLKNCRIIDLGTGTGCIVLTLLKLLPHATAIAIDINSNAIKTAQKNAENLELVDRIEFICTSWTEENFKNNFSSFDIVVSNPPYIPHADIAELAVEVKNFDPMKALDGGLDGLDCYRSIINILPDLLSPSGICFFEIGYNQAKDVMTLLEEKKFSEIIIEKDFAGLDRCISAEKYI